MSSMFSPIFNDKLFSLITTYVHVHLINHCYMQILSVSFFLVSILNTFFNKCTVHMYIKKTGTPTLPRRFFCNVHFMLILCKGTCSCLHF